MPVPTIPIVAAVGPIAVVLDAAGTAKSPSIVGKKNDYEEKSVLSSSEEESAAPAPPKAEVVSRLPKESHGQHLAAPARGEHDPPPTPSVPAPSSSGGGVDRHDGNARPKSRSSSKKVTIKKSEGIDPPPTIPSPPPRPRAGGRGGSMEQDPGFHPRPSDLDPESSHGEVEVEAGSRYNVPGGVDPPGAPAGEQPGPNSVVQKQSSDGQNSASSGGLNARVVGPEKRADHVVGPRNFSHKHARKDLKNQSHGSQQNLSAAAPDDKPSGPPAHPANITNAASPRLSRLDDAPGIERKSLSPRLKASARGSQKSKSARGPSRDKHLPATTTPVVPNGVVDGPTSPAGGVPNKPTAEELALVFGKAAGAVPIANDPMIDASPPALPPLQHSPSADAVVQFGQDHQPPFRRFELESSPSVERSGWDVAPPPPPVEEDPPSKGRPPGGIDRSAWRNVVAPPKSTSSSPPAAPAAATTAYTAFAAPDRQSGGEPDDNSMQVDATGDVDGEFIDEHGSDGTQHQHGGSLDEMANYMGGNFAKFGAPAIPANKGAFARDGRTSARDRSSVVFPTRSRDHSARGGGQHSDSAGKSGWQDEDWRMTHQRKSANPSAIDGEQLGNEFRGTRVEDDSLPTHVLRTTSSRLQYKQRMCPVEQLHLLDYSRPETIFPTKEMRSNPDFYQV